MFLDPEVTGLIPGEKHRDRRLFVLRRIQQCPGQDLQVMLSKTTTISEPNKKPILTQMSPRIKGSMLPSLVLMEDSNGYGTNTTKRHKWTRNETKNLMVCYYKSKPTQKRFMRHIEMLWREKHSTATLDIK